MVNSENINLILNFLFLHLNDKYTKIVSAQIIQVLTGQTQIYTDINTCFVRVGAFPIIITEHNIVPTRYNYG